MHIYMDHKKFLYNFINEFKKKMNISLLLEWCFTAAGLGAAVALFAEITALIVPFYYANHIAASCVVTGVICGAIITFVKRHSMVEAALAIDRFGFEERVITAYEHLEEDGWILELQRNNAAFLLEQNKQMVRQKIWPPFKKILPTVLLCLMVVLIALIPSAQKETAKELHELAEQAQEKQEEIKEALEALEEIDTTGMTEEEIAQIEEMKESLEASMAEMSEIASERFSGSREVTATSEALARANERLDYKYENISEQLNQMYQRTASTEGMQASAESLQNAAQQFGDNSQNGDGGQNGNNGQNSNNGQNGNGNGNSQGDNGDNGNGDGNGRGDGDGSGDGNGNGDGNGSGDGDGNGNGNGDGQNGNGGQGSNGSGTGGDGRGEGSSNAEHDYVSISNDIGNDGTLHGNTTGSETSEFYREQNGLAWEGEHVSYESVIGEYTNRAYEGLEQGRYPSGMTDVIRDYFRSMN